MNVKNKFLESNTDLSTERTDFYNRLSKIDPQKKDFAKEKTRFFDLQYIHYVMEKIICEKLFFCRKTYFSILFKGAVARKKF